MSVARILAIAGSDSGGGAGIQADIRTITLLGGHAMTAVTAITAQNTLGVDAVEVLRPGLVVAQIEAVVRDIGVDAVKIGMLGSAAVAEAVGEWLAGVQVPVVLDPVMIASSGARLLDDDAVTAVRKLMAPATLVTPNFPELEALGGEAALVAVGHTLLVKGGHAAGEIVVDRLVGPEGELGRWSGTRIATRHTHGTGCTLSSAIATGLGQGMRLPDAIGRARDYVRAALASAPGLGAGHGPMGPGVRLPTAARR